MNYQVWEHNKTQGTDYKSSWESTWTTNSVYWSLFFSGARDWAQGPVRARPALDHCTAFAEPQKTSPLLYAKIKGMCRRRHPAELRPSLCDPTRAVGNVKEQKPSQEDKAEKNGGALGIQT